MGRKEELQNNQENINKMASVSPNLSIITLNVSGRHSLIKSHKVYECIKKQDPVVYCLKKIHLNYKNTHRLKVKM